MDIKRTVLLDNLDKLHGKKVTLYYHDEKPSAQGDFGNRILVASTEEVTYVILSEVYENE